MNAVLLAILVMIVLAWSRVHVVLSLIIASVVGGLWAGLSLNDTLDAFQVGIKNGTDIALSYAMLGAFAMAIAHSGLPNTLAHALTNRLKSPKSGKWIIIAVLLLCAMASQNLVPIHIAFIPLIIPPLLKMLNQLQIDRRLIACVLTFGLVNTYMFIPYGFGDIFLNKIIIKNIEDSGVMVSDVSLFHAMAIPALGMLAGLLTAIFISYKKPRNYQMVDFDSQTADNYTPNSSKNIAITLFAIVAAFGVQLYTDSLLIGSLVGFSVFMATGIVRWKNANDVFNSGIKMMAMIGFVMICAQGFAEVLKVTGQISPLVDNATALFDGNKAAAVFVMLILGLIVTMGIGSSFSTVPIIATIYVPMAISLGLSAPATVALIAVAGVLGDAGSPASDSTLGPTMGLDVDSQHDHMQDTVIPTFIHYNIPLIIFGWIAVMVL